MKKSYKFVMILVLLSISMIFVSCLQDNSNKVVKVEESSKKDLAIKNISKEELKGSEKDYFIVDLRDDEPFLGWPENANSRGGHMKDAVQFSYSWLDYMNKADTSLEKMLEERDITKEKKILLYHSDNEISKDFAKQLLEKGYENITIFDDFDAWVKDENCELVSAPHYDMIVSPEWVYELINGGKPVGYNNNKYIVMEGGWLSSEVYDDKHIPGAIFFGTDEVEIADWVNERTEDHMYNYLNPEQIKINLEKKGITYDTTVIMYDPHGASSYAGRSYMALAEMGVKDLKIMNGGFTAWEARGYPIETESVEPIPVDNFGIDVPQRPEIVITTPAEVREKQKDSNFRLVSIRSWEEFTGQTSGYSYITKKGEPKGAVWGHNICDYFDIDGTYKNFDEIKSMLAEWNITEGNEVSYYCGTGWRATVPWIISYANGWENASMYDGGWYTWQLDKNNPIQLGEPKE